MVQCLSARVCASVSVCVCKYMLIYILNLTSSSPLLFSFALSLLLPVPSLSEVHSSPPLSVLRLPPPTSLFLLNLPHPLRSLIPFPLYTIFLFWLTHHSLSLTHPLFLLKSPPPLPSPFKPPPLPPSSPSPPFLPLHPFIFKTAFLAS